MPAFFDELRAMSARELMNVSDDLVTAAYDAEIRNLRERIAMLEEARADYLNAKVEQNDLSEREMMIERLR